MNYFYLTTVCIMLFSYNKGPAELSTASQVNLEKYAGTWYEIARLPNRFEKGLECVTATYTLKDNGKIEVINKGHKVGELNKISKIKEKKLFSYDDKFCYLQIKYFFENFK